MIGLSEIVIIAIVFAVFFFGKNKIVEWAKTIAQVRKAYNKEMAEAPKE